MPRSRPRSPPRPALRRGLGEIGSSGRSACSTSWAPPVFWAESTCSWSSFSLKVRRRPSVDRRRAWSEVSSALGWALGSLASRAVSWPLSSVMRASRSSSCFWSSCTLVSTCFDAARTSSTAWVRRNSM